MLSPLPKKFDISGLKRLFAILLATYTECYIDPFGVVYGISQFDYTIARSKITGSEYEALLPYIKDRYVALPDAYSVIKDLKKTRCEVEYGSDGGILRMVDTADENRIMKLYTTNEVQNFQIIQDNYKEGTYSVLNPDSGNKMLVMHFTMKNKGICVIKTSKINIFQFGSH